MIAPFDLIFAALFSVGYMLWEYAVGWKRTKAALISGRPGARARAYRTTIAVQWTFVAVLAARWISAGRRWRELGLALPEGWRLVAGAVLVLLTAALFTRQARAVARLGEEQRLRLRDQLASVALVLPRTASEQRWFRALAVTAGFCEELLYRGFLVWALRPWLGLAGATAASLVLFTLGHSYQGAKGAVRSGIAGATMAAIVLLTGSLIPAMLVHAIVDLGGGTVGYLILCEPRDEPAPTPLAA